MTPNTCPRCNAQTFASDCCGVIFAQRQRWRVTPTMARDLHALARGRKGLDDDTYRLRLRAFGVHSCKELTREQWGRFLGLLHSLPDARARRKPSITPLARTA